MVQSRHHHRWPGHQRIHRSNVDGRFIYFVPTTSGVTVRYDTTASYEAASSWTTFDTRPLTSDAIGFNGAVFDGRDVYFVPYDDPAKSVGGALFSSGKVVRFDAKSPPSLPPQAGASFY